ncbi:N-acetylneuraminate synthase [Neisseriaceae bacterium JH1-16]|nr:N-acetylneuraminate synthase [Neisseriaceae bacterium JH1-16]
MKRTYIIAEAGVNHNGDLAMAKELINVAARAGADAVKFQTFTSSTLVSRVAPKAGYQLDTTDKEESQKDMLAKLELDEHAHMELARYAAEAGITFLSSPFDVASIDFLLGMDIPLLKVPSGEINNLPYLRRIGAAGKPVVLSTGMASLGDVEAAITSLEQAGTLRGNITVLHCNTEYPTPFDDVNLRAMNTLADAFGVSVGYSDHTLGIEVAIAAVARGATLIEKHFTLDRTLPGPDHRASLEPDELTAMITAIRHVEAALGSQIKQPSASELKNRPIARKSLIAAVGIRQGELFSEANLTTKRPGTGMSPMLWDQVIGKPAPRDFEPDELIEL